MLNRRVVALLILVPAIAGCADSEPAANAHTPAPAWQPTFINETWGLAQNGSLFDGVGAGGFPLAWSWGEWLTGTLPPAWQGAARDEAWIITSATATLTFSPGATALPSTQVRPQFTMWFGTGDSIIEHGFQPGPDVWTEFETVTFPVDSLPMGGLVVDAGQPLVLHVGVYYPGADEVGSGHLMLAQSFLELQGQTIKLLEPGPITTTENNYRLGGGRCVAEVNPMDLAMATMSFEVPANATRVDASLTGWLGAGPPDMDFFITDAAGRTVAYASGPSAPEALHLRAPNLEAAVPGTWSATAYNCQHQLRNITLRVDVMTPAVPHATP